MVGLSTAVRRMQERLRTGVRRVQARQAGGCVHLDSGPCRPGCNEEAFRVQAARAEAAQDAARAMKWLPLGVRRALMTDAVIMLKTSLAIMGTTGADEELDTRRERCDGCGVVNPYTRLCSYCRVQRFCGMGCVRRHWGPDMRAKCREHRAAAAAAAAPAPVDGV